MQLATTSTPSPRYFITSNFVHLPFFSTSRTSFFLQFFALFFLIHSLSYEQLLSLSLHRDSPRRFCIAGGFVSSQSGKSLLGSLCVASNPELLILIGGRNYRRNPLVWFSATCDNSLNWIDIWCIVPYLLRPNLDHGFQTASRSTTSHFHNDRPRLQRRERVSGMK